MCAGLNPFYFTGESFFLFDRTKTYTHKHLVMKQLTIYPIAVFFFLIFGTSSAIAQFNVKITVNGGTSSTTCTDPLGTPDPQWAVNVNNQGWVIYPSMWGCYNNFPNVQFDQTYQCLADVPPTIQVCFRAFENDAFILDLCNPVLSCLAETCIDVPVPLQGSQNFTIQLPANLPSGGSADLTIQATGFPSGLNDAFCDALDIGILPVGVTIGDADTSTFNNYCASGIGDPNPGNFGNWWVNNVGVWFKFTTPNKPGTYFTVRAKSDPSNFGDPVNLQVGIFKTSNNTCTGVPTFVAQNHNPADWDEEVTLNCPLPNTTYFILVDAVWDTQEQLYGWFGIEVEHSAILPAPDLRCQAENLGLVPPGGSVTTNGMLSNACSSNSNSAPATNFSVQKSVWFSFQAPSTGHVLLNAVSDPTDDPIGIQMAAYRSSNGACNGVFTEIYSQYTAADLDESFALHCLVPGETYYVMIDGASGNLTTGNFTLTVTDGGDDTPITDISPVICAGETFTVGTSVYNQDGFYTDTLLLPGGCDSIVNTSLTVLTPIQPAVQIVAQGVWQGNTDGQAQASATGGAGGYSFLWSDGQTSALAVNLIGGNNYCVTITDSNGCSADSCFEMPYYVHFIPTVQPDTLDCNGDQNGVIRFTAIGGIPPYQYTWSNGNGSQNGNGFITTDGEVITLDGLGAGTYTLTMTDIIFDTTMSVEILEPAKLLATATMTNASCFGLCDGSLTALASGGTSPYQFSWSNGSAGSIASGLCAGDYSVTVTDANGCSAAFPFSVGQPAQFIATASEIKSVSCFEGSDGEATVTTNGNPVNYFWGNGTSGATIAGLSGGTYTVTVTNADGCTASASVSISTPNAPVGVNISEAQGVICKGGADGILTAAITGPGTNFSIEWSNGAIGPAANNLAAGAYSVTVENEKGCQATADFTLPEPNDIQVEFTTNVITCTDEPDAGIITVTQVTGGVAPFTFSTNGQQFSPEKELKGYTAGQQRFFVKDQGGCVREFFATIEGPKELLLELDDDMVIDLGESVPLRPTINHVDGILYEWSPPEFLSCSDCPEPVATPTRSELFTLVVTDEFGCTASSDIFLDVVKRRKVFVPNAFSPNGDGINDLFVPFGGNDVQVIKNFRVFDRQGNMVFVAGNFQPEDYGNAWDGSFKGKTMQAGVFAWFAEIEFIDGEIKLFRGDVTLVR